MSANIGAIPKQPKEGNKKNYSKQTNSYAAVTHSRPLRDSNADVIIESESVIDYSPENIRTNVYSSPRKIQNTTLPCRKSKKEQEFDRIILHVRQGTRILILMRGLPGSGKSYLAKEIVDKGIGLLDYFTFILSSDDFFISPKTGMYEYDRTKLQEAHEWNQQRAYNNMSKGYSPVIIDNTNTQMWEMRSYAMMATNFGYTVEIVEPFTYWAFNEKELSRRNSHGVPRTKIKEMLERYEKNITPSKILMMYNLSYNEKFKPPLERTYPPIQHNLAQENGDSSKDLNLFVSLPHVNDRNNVFVTGDEHNHNSGKKSAYDIDLMDFVSDVTSQPALSDDDSVQNIQDISNPIDSILMHTQFSNTDILEPHVWSRHEAKQINTSHTSESNAHNANLNEKHSSIPSINASEPEMKKARKYSLNIFSGSRQTDGTFEKQDLSSVSDEEIAEASASKSAEQLSRARNMYPRLDLSSWGLPENAMSSWESWDIVSPLNCPQQPEQKDVEQNVNIPQSPFLKTSDSATNTSSSDFAHLTLDHLPSENLKILKTRSRDINLGTVVNPPMSPPKKTLLDKSSMTNEDVLSAALSRERSASDEKQIAELVSLFPNIPTDYLKDVYEKCERDLNWAVDLLLDDSKEILQLPNASNVPTELANEYPSSDKHMLEKQQYKSICNPEILQKNMKGLTIASDRVTENSVELKCKLPADDITELKKHIEENVEINVNCYSEHLLKIKNQRRGITNETNFLPLDKACTSKGTYTDTYLEASRELATVKSDIDMDDLEQDIDFPQNESEEEEVMELNLGKAFVSQLETKFGFPEMFPQGFLPIIQVPIWLARQLHALYVESVLGQMEAQNQVLEMIEKEDEELAKKLQMQEHRAQVKQSVHIPNLQEIMDEQVASSLYKKQTEEWKKLTPDNLAARLTRQKLFTAFRTVDESLLVEILHAHSNSYKQTVEVLLASTEQDKVYDPDGTILEPPITETVVNEMKAAEEETAASVNAPDTPKSANEYREEASTHLRKHNELIEKAHLAYQNKQYQVAQFYSDLAKTHTQMYDQANSRAASAFLQEHSQRLESFHTLDLHYLFVKEAIPALDMFIDTNIRLLHGTNKKSENLFVITGRGKRSGNGKSRLKPAVIARLKKRDIWYCEINPGLLKIRVRQHSAVTSNIP